MTDSTVNRPKQYAFGGDTNPTIIANSVALFESIAKNHIFQNANKRTAFVSFIQFLAYNGYELVMPEKEAEDFTVDIVNHVYEFSEIVTIIENNTKKLTELNSG